MGARIAAHPSVCTSKIRSSNYWSKQISIFKIEGPKFHLVLTGDMYMLANPYNTSWKTVAATMLTAKIANNVLVHTVLYKL